LSAGFLSGNRANGSSVILLRYMGPPSAGGIPGARFHGSLDHVRERQVAPHRALGKLRVGCSGDEKDQQEYKEYGYG
jgi:hypothetical protein